MTLYRSFHTRLQYTVLYQLQIGVLYPKWLEQDQVQVDSLDRIASFVNISLSTTVKLLIVVSSKCRKKAKHSNGDFDPKNASKTPQTFFHSFFASLGG